ncbi:unnamed protein product [Amoebophrya sp. A120]|nr:unnamed protein product [Amoebophrya sp. A120]|eukprot:GSA120T00010837001.1
MGESLGFMAPGLVTGTTVFLILGIIGAVVSQLVARETQNCTKSEARMIGGSVVVMSTVCMWMFWAFTYMHQMVPLIYPIHTPPTTG